MSTERNRYMAQNWGLSTEGVLATVGGGIAVEVLWKNKEEGHESWLTYRNVSEFGF